MHRIYDKVSYRIEIWQSKKFGPSNMGRFYMTSSFFFRFTGAAEVELLRSVKRTRGGLARHRHLRRKCLVQRLVTRVVEIQHGEIRRRAVARGEIVTDLRGAKHV